jgi:threonine/homoserine/homoserine lactone efflux protein
MIALLAAGVTLGLSAGFSPGPLLALVVSQTIRHGFREGAKVAFAPVITDFPIIFLSTLLLANLSGTKSVLGLVSIVGGLFLVYLAVENVKTTGMEVTLDEGEPRSFLKGAMVNALSPHPYIFWMTVGGPLIMRGASENLLSPALFIASFLGCLVGSKMVLAVLVSRSRHFLTGKPYVYIMRFLGLALLLFAGVLFWDGLHHLR